MNRSKEVHTPVLRSEVKNPLKRIVVQTTDKTPLPPSQAPSPIVKKDEYLDEEDNLYLLRNSSPEELISFANQIQMEIYSDEKCLNRIQGNSSEEDFSDEEIEEVISRIEEQKQRVRIILDFVGSENYYLDEKNKAYLKKHSQDRID